jgi:hypothetical protein
LLSQGLWCGTQVEKVVQAVTNGFLRYTGADVSAHLARRCLRESASPELLALPAPPKRERGITVATMALTALAAALLAWSLRSEARYAQARPRRSVI